MNQTDVAKSSIPKPLLRLWNLIGLDSAIAFTLLARACAGVITLVTVVLIARFLTPAEQGYYYSFNSLVALQVVFELGLSFVILQLASHERSVLTIGDDGTVTGDALAHARLASILRKAVRWYSIAAVLMVVFLIPAGLRFFSLHAAVDQDVHWIAPWCAAVLVTGFTFQIDPVFSFLEGCGYISHVARTRFAQSILGGLLAATALITHHGLFAPACTILGQALAGSGLLISRRRLLLNLLKRDPGPHGILWKSEVWPFQWRIAVSWLSGYFIFQLFNPILFASRGAVEAGQMGMSLTIANGLVTVAYAWLSTKASPFGVMIARKEFALLDQVFFKALKQAVAIVSLGAVTVLSVLLYVTHHGNAFAHRVIAPRAMLFLLLAVVINTVVFSEALYLRAHKQEKFMLQSVMSAVLIATLGYVLGRAYGSLGMAFGYFLINLFVGLGLGTYTFVKYRNLWHNTGQVSPGER